MDRQTLDMEGARRGEISSASLQMGDDTIAIQRIATMSVESMEFFPWDTPANRRVKSVYASFFVVNLFFGFMALAWWGLFPAQPSSLFALVAGGALMLIALFLGLRAVMITLRLKHRQPYFRLVIGASDGRQIPLVDDNRDVLIRIRDAVRQKMDTGDREIQGDFDLDLDLVNLRQASMSGDRAPDPKRLGAERDDPESDGLFDKEPDMVKAISSA